MTSIGYYRYADFLHLTSLAFRRNDLRQQVFRLKPDYKLPSLYHYPFFFQVLRQVNFACSGVTAD
jgi:hypothetical protein